MMFMIPGATSIGIDIVHTGVNVNRINIGSPSMKTKYITHYETETASVS